MLKARVPTPSVAAVLRARTTPARVATGSSDSTGISALCVTRRPEHLRKNLVWFVAQTHPHKELVVVTDPDKLDKTRHVLDEWNVSAQVLAATGKLGYLRNLAVERARTKYVMQWDDDDFHHPERMVEQLRSLQANNLPCGFLGGWVSRKASLGVGRAKALGARYSQGQGRVGLVGPRQQEGSLIAERQVLLGCYPHNITRVGTIGEDTLCVRRLKLNNVTCDTLHAPWLYVYNLHASQTVDRVHQELILNIMSDASMDLNGSPVLPPQLSAAYGTAVVGSMVPFWLEIRQLVRAWATAKGQAAGGRAPSGAIVSLFLRGPDSLGKSSEERRANSMGGATSQQAAYGLAMLARRNHEAYARRHGYLLLNEDNSSSPQLAGAIKMVHPPSWAKVILISDLLTNSQYRHVAHWAWLDADAFVIRPEWSLPYLFYHTTTQVLSRRPANVWSNCRLTFGSDVGMTSQFLHLQSAVVGRTAKERSLATTASGRPSRFLNAGVFLFYNQPQVRRIFRLAIADAERNRFANVDWEQTTIANLFLDHAWVRKVMCIVNRTSLQALVKIDQDRALAVSGKVWAAHMTYTRWSLPDVQRWLQKAVAAGAPIYTESRLHPGHPQSALGTFQWLMGKFSRF